MTSRKIALLASLPLLCVPLHAQGKPTKPAAKATLAREEGVLARAMVAALDNKDLVAVKLLLKHGGDANARGSTGRTPLLLASYQGDAKFVETLLTKGARVNDASNRQYGRETPLLLATYKGNSEVARLLIKNGADINTRSTRGQTPLLLAAGNSSNTLIKILLDAGVTVDATGKQPFGSMTPLMLAAQNANVEGVKLLIEHGANVNAHESHGFSVLMLASSAVSSMSGTSLGITERDRKQLQANQDAIVALLKAAGAKDYAPGFPSGQYKRVGENLGF